METTNLVENKKSSEKQHISAQELAILCAKAAAEIQAQDIRVWDLRGLSSVTDFMVVCSGDAMPHLRAILRDIKYHVFEWCGENPVYAEGKLDSKWMVLDFVNVMVHIMHSEMREHYAIEELWGDAKLLEWDNTK